MRLEHRMKELIFQAIILEDSVQMDYSSQHGLAAFLITTHIIKLV
nr:MAG TPA: hypothetical protein [Caudoviricetes sp.]